MPVLAAAANGSGFNSMPAAGSMRKGRRSRQRGMPVGGHARCLLVTGHRCVFEEQIAHQTGS